MLRWLGRTFLCILLMFLNLAFLGAVGLWARSYFVNDLARWGPATWNIPGQDTWEMLSTRGKWVWRFCAAGTAPDIASGSVFVVEHPATASPNDFSAVPGAALPGHGFALQRYSAPYRWGSTVLHTTTLALPAWLVTLLLLPVPAMRCYAAWKRRRRDPKPETHTRRFLRTLRAGLWRSLVNASMFLLLLMLGTWIASHRASVQLEREPPRWVSEQPGTRPFRLAWSVAMSQGTIAYWSVYMPVHAQEATHVQAPARYHFQRAPVIQLQPRSTVGAAWNKHLGPFQFATEQRTVYGGHLLDRYYFAAAPIWALVILFSVLPAMDLFRHLRQHARRGQNVTEPPATSA